MEKIPDRKTAGVLHALVWMALTCNVIALYLAPMAVEAGSADLFAEGHLILAYLLGSWKAWAVVGWWRVFDAGQMVLTLLLLFSGCCTAVLLWRARRRLKSILLGKTFAWSGAVKLRRAGGMKEEEG